MVEPATLVYPLRMPDAPGFREITWGMDSVVAVTESPFTFRQQTYAWPGQRWKCAVRLPPMRDANARNWMAFFATLNGQEGTFLLSDSSFALRAVGDGLGDPETDGAQAAGRAITTKGWTANKLVARAGDMFEIAGRLRRVMLDCHSDADGKATLAIWPNVTALDDGVPIEWLEPKGVFRLASEIESTWDINRMMAGLQFACIEAM